MTNGCELNCTFGSTWHEEVAKVIEKSKAAKITKSHIKWEKGWKKQNIVWVVSQTASLAINWSMDD